MLYVDTSVLLVYTLTQTVERERYGPTTEFFARVASGSLTAATSFYALHEVHVAVRGYRSLGRSSCLR